MNTGLQKMESYTICCFQNPLVIEQYVWTSLTINIVFHHILSIFKMGKLKFREIKQLVKASKEMI